jgi:hypothetical protein
MLKDLLKEKYWPGIKFEDNQLSILTQDKHPNLKCWGSSSKKDRKNKDKRKYSQSQLSCDLIT